jgi:integrase
MGVAMGVKVRLRQGVWWVFVNHKGKRRAKRIGEKHAAQRVAREIQERLAAGELNLPMPGDETLQTYAENWLASATLKASTVRFYGDNLVNHIVPLLGAIPVAQLSRQHVKDLLVAVRKKGLKPRTATGVLRTLSTVMSEAVEDGKLPANPALRPGRMNRTLRNPNELKKNPVDPYTREQVDVLLATAERHFPDWYVFMLCALRTGMRLGELRALEWDAIDWRNRFIEVRRNYVEGAFTVPKNGLTRRVDTSTQLRAQLRLWRRQQRLVWLRQGQQFPTLVFPSNAGTPLDDSRVRKAMVAIARKGELMVRKQPVHVLRHTFASLLLQQGESLVYVKEQMGHSSIQITVDIYGHLVPGGNRGAVDRLDSTHPPATPAQPAVAAKSAGSRKVLVFPVS